MDLNSSTLKTGLSLSVMGTLIVSGITSGLLLVIGRKDYPELHTILDTGMLLMSGVLALLLWEMISRVDRSFLRWSAISFAIASLFELVHALVSIEWSGPLQFIALNASTLRPSTWPPAALILPIGLGWSVWMLRRAKQGSLIFGLTLLLVTVGLVLLFSQLPRYSSPTWLGITRPALIPAPFLWAIVGWACWNWRSSDRLLPALTLMAIVLFLANVSMLYSRSPHDTPAMVAHLGRVTGYFVLLLSVMHLASVDMSERIRAEQALGLRARTDAALRKSQADLSLIVEGSPSALLLVDEEGLMTLVNNQAEQLFGYGRQELLGQRVEMLVPERYRSYHPGHRKLFSQHPTTRSMGAGRDLFGVRKDGSEVPIEIGLNPIQTHEGAFVLASIIDITERKRAEQQFRQVIESAPSGMVMVDQEGKIALVNTQIETSFGYTRDELLGQPIEMLIPQRFRAQHAIYRDDFIASPLVKSIGPGRELLGLRKDASEFPVEIGLSPMQTEQGTMVLGTVVDITERKLAELAAARLVAIVESSSDAIIGKDLDMLVTSWNAGAERMFGYSASEMVGQSISRLIPTQRRAEEERILSYIRQGENLEHFETQRVRKDGKLIDVSVTVSPIKDAEGKVVGASKVARDITERKQMEQARRASEERYRTLFDCAPDGIVIANSDGYYVDANASICRMLGYSRDELIGLHSSDIVTEEEAKHIEPALRVISAKTDYHREWQFRRKDGLVFAAEVVVTMMPDGNLLGMIRDITERKLVESAARQSEDRLDFALQVSETGAWDLDLVDRTAYRSVQHDRIFGYQTLLPTWTFEMFLDHVLPEDRDEVVNLFTRATADQGDWSFECRIRRVDGEIRWIWACGRHRFDQAGAPRKMSGIVQDVTERKRAELEILKLNEELEKRVADRTAQLQAVNEELEAFSYSVSHDLRAPLRHINGFSQALLEDYADKLDETGKGYLQEVRGASQEMARLIDDVLDLARVTRSEMRLQIVNLSELANSIVIDMQKGDGGRTVTVEIEEGMTTLGDRRLLQIMLINLLGNAWKFTSKGAEAEISFGQTQKAAEFVYFVRDNGAGFDMAYVDKLFVAFQRLHTVREFEGTGIGLATVQRIVHRHGGRVWAESALNQGATFFFTLANFKENGNGTKSDPAGGR
ncbi:MAG: PAS domain S-box protein [Pyrinomonadaceae bacterium]|nr:PAS domain S-box protein [Pyrinomonadaceae bacterium]